MKCSICGAELANPNSKKHIESQRHLNALNRQGSQKILPGAVTRPPSGGVNVDGLNTKIASLEKRVESIERRLDSLIPLQKKIPIQDFKNRLVTEYDHVNPSHDISGVEYEILQRRVCRELQISPEYYDDLIYDLQKGDRIITIQSGREKKYIQVRKV